MSLDNKSAPEFWNDGLESNEFADYWQVIYGYRWVILAMTGIAMVISTIYFSILPNKYTAEVQILVEKMDPRPKTYQEMVMPGSIGEEDYYGTQVAMLTGRNIKESVRAELALDKEYKFKIQAKKLRGTRIISFKATDKNPEMASKLANKFAEIYMSRNMEDSLYMPQQLLKWLPKNLDDLDKLDAADVLTLPQGLNKREYLESLKSVATDPIVQKLKSDKLDAEAGLREFSQRYKSQHPVIKELNGKLAYLDAEINDRVKQVVGGLKANLAGEFQITNIKIIEEAIPPKNPSEPKRLLGILLTTLLALFSSTVLILFLEYTNQKIRTEEDCGPGFGTPFLGYVPLVEELARGDKQASSNGEGPFSLVEILKENNELSDALSNLRTRILFSMPLEKSKRIMITSAMPSEGKSTISALLALSLANIGEKVLLVSMDIRRPFLAKYLNVQESAGLTDFLVGSVKLENIIYDVQGTAMKLVTGGTSSPNPVELLESKYLAEFFERVSLNFDRIIIDVAPALFIPDGMIVSKHIHSNILVCGAGMVHKRVAKTLIDKFKEVGHPFIGVIINRANYQHGAYGYRYKYYKAYQSYYKKKEETISR